ncbi:hypothetical protein NDU88_006022 [Pleurodeles waltl]|uniref:Uncharacterized protein n=1 Tax=Pleurodeles waltl TaxID=8319 RepID=A0AAV7LR75_PLEWA|nr:hypothetical protein NDU88_006022 [Pleurodeles waltl]
MTAQSRLYFKASPIEIERHCGHRKEAVIMPQERSDPSSVAGDGEWGPYRKLPHIYSWQGLAAGLQLGYWDRSQAHPGSEDQGMPPSAQPCPG